MSKAIKLIPIRSVIGPSDDVGWPCTGTWRVPDLAAVDLYQYFASRISRAKLKTAKQGTFGARSGLNTSPLTFLSFFPSSLEGGGSWPVACLLPRVPSSPVKPTARGRSLILSPPMDRPTLGDSLLSYLLPGSPLPSDSNAP